MKKLARICLAFSLFAAAVMPVFAQTSVETASAKLSEGALVGARTGYQKASDVQYNTSGKYMANWGARGEECGFLTSYANNFYTGSYSYDTMSLKTGGSSQSNAPSSALYSTLKSLMSSKHSNKTSYDATKEMYRYTDCVNSQTSNISSFYSGKKLTGSWDSAATWNREHTWPNSKGLGGSDENDIIMLRPTWVQENSSRGNTAYGSGSGYFDPGEDVRGDCARIVLYVYTRWGNTSYMWGKSGVMESKDVLLNWMEEDPVDTWEMGRNDVVQDITGTRNVFVDYPEYAWLLFGETAPNDMVTPSGKASNGMATPNPGTTPDGSDTPTDTPTNPTTQKEIVDAAYALSNGTTLDGGPYTLTGKITNVKEYDSSSTNICLTMQVEGKNFYCYWMKDNASGDNKNLAVGDTITVTGTIKNYNGTVEFDKPNLGTVVKAGSSSTPSNPTTPSNPSEPSNPTTPEPPSVDEEIELPEVGENGCVHEFGEWFVITPATTEEEGEKACYCNKCGEEYTAKIPVLTEEEANNPDDTSDLDPEPSVDNNILGNLTASCESSIGVPLVGMTLLAVGAVLFKRKKDE